VGNGLERGENSSFLDPEKKLQRRTTSSNPKKIESPLGTLSIDRGKEKIKAKVAAFFGEAGVHFSCGIQKPVPRCREGESRIMPYFGPTRGKRDSEGSWGGRNHVSGILGWKESATTRK